MSVQEMIIGIGGMVVHHNPITLTCLGLGSCVGVALFDAEDHIGGLAHIMLPNSTEYRGIPNPERDTSKLLKYADIAIPKMIEEMINIGAKKENIKAKIAGGAQMFDIETKEKSIGERNIESVKKILQENNVYIIKEDVGGHVGRTMRFDTATQIIKIRTINEEKEI